MPQTAKMIDEMRVALGVDIFNDMLKKAMNGQPGYFYAKENGLEFGTRDTRTTCVIRWNECGISYASFPEWMTDALLLAEQRGIQIEHCDPGDPDETRRLAVRLRKILAEGNNDASVEKD